MRIMLLDVILLEMTMPMKMKAILSMIVAMMVELLIIMEVPALKQMTRSSSYEETTKVT